MFDSLLTSQFSSRGLALSPLVTELPSIATRLDVAPLFGSGLGSIATDTRLFRSMAQIVSSEVKQVVNQFSGRVPFADGKLKLDIATGFGNIQGTIEFGNGALVSNLNTPLGAYFSSIDFKPQDQIKFQTGQTTGILNFNDGLVIVDLQPQVTGDEIAFPINVLTGAIEFKHGQAIVNTDGFGTVAKFDLSALAQRAVTDVLTDSFKKMATNNSTSAIAPKIDFSALLG
jgi:hypothetical protein